MMCNRLPTKDATVLPSLADAVVHKNRESSEIYTPTVTPSTSTTNSATTSTSDVISSRRRTIDAPSSQNIDRFVGESDGDDDASDVNLDDDEAADTIAIQQRANHLRLQNGQLIDSKNTLQSHSVVATSTRNNHNSGSRLRTKINHDKDIGNRNNSERVPHNVNILTLDSPIMTTAYPAPPSTSHNPFENRPPPFYPYPQTATNEDADNADDVHSPTTRRILAEASCTDFLKAKWRQTRHSHKVCILTVLLLLVVALAATAVIVVTLRKESGSGEETNKSIVGTDASFTRSAPTVDPPSSAARTAPEVSSRSSAPLSMSPSSSASTTPTTLQTPSPTMRPTSLPTQPLETFEPTATPLTPTSSPLPPTASPETSLPTRQPTVAPSHLLPQDTTTVPTPRPVPNQTPTSLSPIRAPTTSKTTTAPVQSRAVAVTNFINDITLLEKSLTVPESFTPFSASTISAEQAALSWLVFEDPLQLWPNTTVNQFRLQQRYALLTLLLQFPALAAASLANDECDWLQLVGSCIESTEPPTLGVNVVTEIYINGAQTGPGSTLSPDLSLLSNLESFDVWRTGLSGRLPSLLGTTWTKLATFDVVGNALTGSLPSTLGMNWTNLQYFEVSENLLSGRLPPSLGSTWSNLVFFDAPSNALTGSLPSSLGPAWINMQSFDVSYNALSGSLPSSLGSTWTSLGGFYVVGNALTGNIPNLASNWDQISGAFFHNNSFVGSMPNGLCPIGVERTINLRADCDEVVCQCCRGCCSDAGGCDFCIGDDCSPGE